MTIKDTIFATALAVATALPAAAEGRCKIGSATDGKSYRLCEYKNEVIVEEILGSTSNYDESINAIIKHKREADAPSHYSSVASVYFGANGSIGGPRTTEVAGLTLGATMAGGWRGEISVYPQSLWSRGRAALSTREAHRRIPASAFLGYTLANLGSTAVYAGTEVAISHSSISTRPLSTGMQHRTEAIIGFVIGMNHTLNKNVSVDVSYRNYIGTQGNTFFQKVRLSMNFAI